MVAACARLGCGAYAGRLARLGERIVSETRNFLKIVPEKFQRNLIFFVESQLTLLGNPQLSFKCHQSSGLSSCAASVAGVIPWGKMLKLSNEMLLQLAERGRKQWVKANHKQTQPKTCASIIMTSLRFRF